MKNVIVIGGGAAGLMAAAVAAKRGNNVTVIEKNQRPARKLMITGKGRCNLTNNCDIDTLIANVNKNGRFLYSAFSGFNSQDVMEYFENLGVPLKTERGGRVFPQSDKAVDIVDALVNSARKNGANIINGQAEEILTEKDSVVGVKLSNGDILNADSVVLATGGLSYSVTGSTGDGYAMAKKLGHTITDITPSLVPINIHEGFCTKLSGLSLKNVTLAIFEEGKKKPIFKDMGEMLFTHFGISGPLTLSASCHIRKIPQKSYKAVIDLKPALSYEQLDSRILRDFNEEKNKDFSNSLNKLLPKSLIPVVVSLSGIPADTKVNQISRENRAVICKLLKEFTLNITSLRSVEEAIITSGGISVKEINPTTMESKLFKGLFFAGEIIDADAYTGGFNLQIAFSTAFAAGNNV